MRLEPAGTCPGTHAPGSVSGRCAHGAHGRNLAGARAVFYRPSEARVRVPFVPLLRRACTRCGRTKWRSTSWRSPGGLWTATLPAGAKAGSARSTTRVGLALADFSCVRHDLSWSLVAVNNLERREHVRRQLELRREVLTAWAKTGVSGLPEGTNVPDSLNQVRQWADARLGITGIGSAASFTKTHRVHGALVRDIDRLLRELAQQRAAQLKRKNSRGAKRARRLALLESSLASAANRYAALSAELDETKLQLRVAEQSVEAFKRENTELRTEVRNFKAELARRCASGTVTSIVDMVRRGPP